MPDDARRPWIGTRLLTRFATDGAGHLQGGRLLATAALATVFVALGTSAASVAAGAGNPAMLSIWVVIAFVAIKVPLLALLWWILGRNPGDENPTDEELRAMIVRLRARAEAAAGAPDAHDRLEILREEAWFVADRAPADMRSEAVELAVMIDSLGRDTVPTAGA